MKTAWKLVSVGAATAMVAACSHTVTEREVVRQPVVQVQPQRTVENVTIIQPPPAPQEQMPPAPAATGYSWVPGHYAWRNGAWHWDQGQWRVGVVPPMPPLMQESIPAAPVSTARWVPGYWSFGDTGWTWMKGHWEY
ncbi:MAG: hypothetical protein E6H58_20970 [Betaproteobacteria bacterium]|jgi:hypothetical protein|nr:MAG: hypothetical protein E6H65_13400 [Betaproteobacteria bacterium]TMH26466.1 MAG: hypothetical protein E6H58_20970 [Betaproteobacteria bacterium]